MMRALMMTIQIYSKSQGERIFENRSVFSKRVGKSI